MSNKRELNGSNKCELNGSILLPRALHGIKMLELKVLHLDKKGRLNDSMLHLNFNALQVTESWLGLGNEPTYDSGF